MIAAIGLFGRLVTNLVECRWVRDEEEVTVVAFRGELLSNILKHLQYGDADGIAHHVGKLIPNDKQTVVCALVAKFVLNLHKPVANLAFAQKENYIGLSLGGLGLLECPHILAP